VFTPATPINPSFHGAAGLAVAARAMTVNIAAPVAPATPAGGEDPDALVPEPPATPVTRPGDLWLLGPHRLLCGHSTSAAEVARLLGGARPHLMITDPPCGVNYDPKWRNEAGVSARMRTGRVANDDRADCARSGRCSRATSPMPSTPACTAARVIEGLEAAGFVIRSQIVGAKSRFVLGRGDYRWQHEPCLHAVRKGTPVTGRVLETRRRALGHQQRWR
jgi:hypothetical protein